MPQRQYAVVYRRYYLGQSFKVIGTALDVSEDGAKKLHRRTVIATTMLERHSLEGQILA